MTPPARHLHPTEADADRAQHESEFRTRLNPFGCGSAIQYWTHRCVFHSAIGIYTIEDIFGRFVAKSDGKQLFVRDMRSSTSSKTSGSFPA